MLSKNNIICTPELKLCNVYTYGNDYTKMKIVILGIVG